MRRFNTGAIIAGLLSVLFLASAASAEVSWDDVKKKATGAKSYSVLYKYSGPRGKYDFDYAFKPGNVRTEILRGSDKTKVGTVIVYDKGWNADRVRAKTGGGTIVRNLTHDDVKDTPFYRSIYDMILDQVASLGKPSTSTSGSNTVFTFNGAGGQYRIWANEDAEIVKTERKDGRDSETRRFASHKWNNNPKTDF